MVRLSSDDCQHSAYYTDIQFLTLETPNVRPARHLVGQWEEHVRRTGSISRLTWDRTGSANGPYDVTRHKERLHLWCNGYGCCGERLRGWVRLWLQTNKLNYIHFTLDTDCHRSSVKCIYKIYVRVFPPISIRAEMWATSLASLNICWWLSCTLYRIF